MFNAKVQLQLNDVQSETKLRDKAMWRISKLKDEKGKSMKDIMDVP